MSHNLWITRIHGGLSAAKESYFLTAKNNRITAHPFFTLLHYLLSATGFIAIATATTLYFKPQLIEHFKHLPVFVSAAPMENVAPPNLNDMINAGTARSGATIPASAAAATLAEDASLLGTQKQQQWVTNWLSKRYRVANDATNMLVSATYLTAKEIKLDPLLILSVMAIESGFNPFAESPMGAQGLMQVMSKLHHDKFQELGGVKAALNPVANIRVGALILKDYVTRGGSVEAGLKLYVGAATQENDAGYGARVLAEYKRLKDVSIGKSVPTFIPTAVVDSTPIAPAATKPAPAQTEQATASGEHLAQL